MTAAPGGDIPDTVHVQLHLCAALTCVHDEHSEPCYTESYYLFITPGGEDTQCHVDNSRVGQGHEQLRTIETIEVMLSNAVDTLRHCVDGLLEFSLIDNVLTLHGHGHRVYGRFGPFATDIVFPRRLGVTVVATPEWLSAHGL